MDSDILAHKTFYEPLITWFQQLKAKEKMSIYGGRMIFSLRLENKAISLPNLSSELKSRDADWVKNVN